MEVLLPPEFNTELLVFDIINYKHTDGVIYLSSNDGTWATYTGPGTTIQTIHKKTKPPKGSGIFYSMYKTSAYNAIIFKGICDTSYPKTNYCYFDDNGGHYNSFKLDKCETDVVEFLKEPLIKYNGTPRYVINSRKVLLFRTFGAMEGKELEDLLNIDNDVLINEISSFGVKRGGISVGDQPILMKSFHMKLFGTTPVVREPPINIPILDTIKSRIDELNSSIGTLRDIYNSTEQVGRLRETLRTDHEDQLKVNDQLIESANIISELRSTNNKLANKVAKLKQNRQILNKQITDLSSQVSNHVDVSAKQKKLIGELNNKLTSLNKRINVLEVNAAKDEAIITNLRAEKAFWNTNTTDYETKKQHDAELAELKSKIEKLMS